MIETGTKQMEQSYSGRGWRGVNSDIARDIKDIAKAIKSELKRLYPTATFSVSTNTHSMCESLHIYLMSWDRDVFVPVDSINWERVCVHWPSDIPAYKAQHQKLIDGLTNHQLNAYYIAEDYRLTDDAKSIMLKVKALCDSFNHSDTDSMTDYFDRGFYDHLNIGKWDKPFVKK